MGARRIRRELRQQDQRRSRIVNGIVKNKERVRRQERLVKKLKEGKLPYIPPVMSWLSAELKKPSKAITQEDVDQYLAANAN